MNEPKEYTIIYFEAGDYKDPNGNSWCNILFEEAKNEPIRIVVKDPSQYTVGQKLYGHIEVKTSQAGKPYNRFYRDKRPDFGQAGSSTAAPSPGKYNTKDNDTQESIARSVALKAAVDSFKGSANMEHVLTVADTYLAWLQGGDKPVEAVDKPATIPLTRPWERVGKYQDRDEDIAIKQQLDTTTYPDEPPDDYPM